MKCLTARKILFERGSATQEPQVREHLHTCADCRRYLANDRTFEGLIEKSLTPSSIPPHLREKILHSLAVEKRGVPFSKFNLPKKWLVAALLLVAVGLGSMALLRNLKPTASPWAEALINDHIEYLPKAHPEQIFSSSPREIEEWFKGKLPFLFTVPDLEKANLLGGRLCFLRGEKSALLFYEITGQPVSLFIMSNEKKPLNDLKTLSFKDQPLHWSASKGVNVVGWEKDGVVYAMVSQMDKSTLLKTIHSF